MKRWAPISLVLLAGCLLAARPVRLLYSPSRNTVRQERKNALQPAEFVDRRSDKLIGWATSAKVIKVPLRAQGDAIRWMTGAILSEIGLLGYKTDPDAPWKIGAVLEQLHCGPGPRIVCGVRLSIWIRSKDNWPVLQKTYKGEGSRPPLLPDEDPYELSLDEALRDAMAQFRRDVELAVP